MADILSKSHRFRTVPNEVIFTSKIVASAYIAKSVCSILGCYGVVGETSGRKRGPWVGRSGTWAAGDAIRVLTLKVNVRDGRRMLRMRYVKLITTAAFLWLLFLQPCGVKSSIGLLKCPRRYGSQTLR